jgi:hypothetical protein
MHAHTKILSIHTSTHRELFERRVAAAQRGVFGPQASGLRVYYGSSGLAQHGIHAQLSGTHKVAALAVRVHNLARGSKAPQFLSLCFENLYLATCFACAS